MGRHIHERVTAEVRYRHLYGAEWKEHYSADRHVTVEKDHNKLLVAAGGVAVVVTLCFMIYRQVLPRQSGRRRFRRRRTHSPPVPS